jgi:hypothetical protein
MSTTTKTIKAASNPNLANALADQAINGTPEEQEVKVEVKYPSDNIVELPGGYITSVGKLVTTAEVRELTGRDEEAIARSGSLGRALNAILVRGVVKLGTEAATEEMLDLVLGGDRDELLLGIYRVTFGNPAELTGYCVTCDSEKTVAVDLDTDIVRIPLKDRIADRDFTVTGRKGVEYEVHLPVGKTQKEIFTNLDKSGPELTTILLQNTITKIGGMPVYDKRQVLDIGVADRDIISNELAKRVSGPKFDDIRIPCTECGSDEVVVPLNLGRLFRL